MRALHQPRDVNVALAYAVMDRPAENWSKYGYTCGKAPRERELIPVCNARCLGMHGFRMHCTCRPAILAYQCIRAGRNAHAAAATTTNTCLLSCSISRHFPRDESRYFADRHIALAIAVFVVAWPKKSRPCSEVVTCASPSISRWSHIGTLHPIDALDSLLRFVAARLLPPLGR